MKRVLLSLLFAMGCRGYDDSPPHQEPPQVEQEMDLPPVTEQVPNRPVEPTHSYKASPSPVELGQTLHQIKVSRLTRTNSALVDRMKSVLEEMTDTTPTYLSQNDLLAWASSAISSPGLGAGISPLDTTPDVTVHYLPYVDTLKVQDVSVMGYTPNSFNPVGGVDYGIGQSTARTAANDLRDKLEVEGVIGSDWEGDPSFEHSMRQRRAHTSGSFEWERVYIFTYRREFDGFPLWDTQLEIGISGQLSPAKAAFVKLSDVSVTDLHQTDQADLTTTEAQAEFLDAADTFLGGPDEIMIQQDTVAYVIDPNKTSDTVYPRYSAFFGAQTNNSYGAGYVAAISMIRVGRYYPWELHHPWSGARPDPDLFPDGTTCNGDSSCASGSCWRTAAFGGICGECNEADDCASNETCDHPRFMSGQWTPPECVPIELGAGCDTGSNCACAQIFYSPALFELKTCSECRDDPDCTGGTVCSPNLDLGNQVVYNECINTGTRTQDEACWDDDECSSGHCKMTPIAGLGDVGVCGECQDDNDCSGQETCSPAFATIFGLAGAQCE